MKWVVLRKFRGEVFAQYSNYEMTSFGTFPRSIFLRCFTCGWATKFHVWMGPPNFPDTIWFQILLQEKCFPNFSSNISRLFQIIFYKRRSLFKIILKYFHYYSRMKSSRMTCDDKYPIDYRLVIWIEWIWSNPLSLRLDLYAFFIWMLGYSWWTLFK